MLNDFAKPQTCVRSTIGVTALILNYYLALFTTEQ